MSRFALSIFLNHSILFAAIAGVIRFKSVLKSYYPFLVFVWLAFANETLSLVLILTGRRNAINSNVYVLFEYLILLYQFYKWYAGTAKKLYFFAVPGILIWIADNLVLHSLSDNNSLFRSVSALVLLFFSIDRMNRVIVYYNRNLLTNSVFLVCASFLPYYGCKLFLELFHLYGIPLSSDFYEYTWLTLSVINCAANLVYAIAILCMPTKEEFMLLY